MPHPILTSRQTRQTASIGHGSGVSHPSTTLFCRYEARFLAFLAPSIGILRASAPLLQILLSSSLSVLSVPVGFEKVTTMKPENFDKFHQDPRNTNILTSQKSQKSPTSVAGSTKQANGDINAFLSTVPCTKPTFVEDGLQSRVVSGLSDRIKGSENRQAAHDLSQDSLHFLVRVAKIILRHGVATAMWGMYGCCQWSGEAGIRQFFCTPSHECGGMQELTLVSCSVVTFHPIALPSHSQS